MIDRTHNLLIRSIKITDCFENCFNLAVCNSFTTFHKEYWITLSYYDAPYADQPDPLEASVKSKNINTQLQ